MRRKLKERTQERKELKNSTQENSIKLLQNHNSIESKYKLEKITKLSKKTLERRINLLRELSLILLKEKKNSRNPISIELTEKGIDLSIKLTETIDMMERILE